MKILAVAVIAAFGIGAPALASADGAAMWKSGKCAKCHGETGKGDSKMGKKKGLPNMSTAQWQSGITDDAIKTAITKGINRVGKDGKKKKMKALKDATPENVAALLALIRSWAPKG